MMVCPGNIVHVSTNDGLTVRKRPPRSRKQELFVSDAFLKHDLCVISRLKRRVWTIRHH